MVFLRGVNLGGKTFKPSETAKALNDLEVTSIQAAGTFVVKAKSTAAATKRRFADVLPFACEIMVRPAKEVEALIAAGPPGKAPAGAKPFVSVLAKKPDTVPSLPVEKPDKKPWEVRLSTVDGHYAWSWWRGVAGARLYPNEVVEKALGVAATTRGWPTMLQVGKALG